MAWPPKGVHLAVRFAAPKTAPLAMQDVAVVLHYELYDGIPLMAKWITVETAGAVVTVDATTVDIFAANARFGTYPGHGSYQPGAAYNGAPDQSQAAPMPLLFASTDQAHGTLCFWMDDYPNSHDPDALQDQGAVEPYLNCSYQVGLGVVVNTHQPFTSFRALHLVSDSVDIERQTLGRLRATQILVPHVTENPIFFHATDVTEAGFKRIIDQMADVGFEMLIYSFGSDFVLETEDPLYLSKIKKQIDYAKSKGIEVGGYDLIVLDRGHGGYGGNVGDQWDIVVDGKLGLDACIASGWYDKILNLTLNFIEKTGLSMIEADGPYGGGSCGANNHSYHADLSDSIYRQTEKQNEFFHLLRGMGLYINQPDNYFYQGGGKTGMGYDEQQYSLPRWHDISISRMGMYDDLYRLLPTQGNTVLQFATCFTFHTVLTVFSLPLTLLRPPRSTDPHSNWPASRSLTMPQVGCSSR